MERIKQIEEMALDFDTVMQRRCFHRSCNECEFDRYDTCKATMLATTLINDYGYSKASEVAREIFEEIWRVFDTAIWAHEIEIKSSKALRLADIQKFADRKLAIKDMKDYLRIVEKKYTEGEK